ncbi:hypothetical protein C8J56DRAFT_925446, partial [Mycena floridula]
MEPKLSKAQTMQTDIEESVVTIMDQDGEIMALRMTGQLLPGVQCCSHLQHLLDDCNEALLKIKLVSLHWSLFSFFSNSRQGVSSSCWRHDRGSACCKQECHYPARCRRCRYQRAYSRHGLPCTTLTPLALAPRILTRISTWVSTRVKETALVSMVVLVLDEIVEQARRAGSMTPSAIGSDIL